MSEDKFLRRWSRRKREAKATTKLPETEMQDDVQSASPPAVKDEESEFDVSSLPPIDSITSATDITAFLRRGIPQELTRAALRRAWSADPAIRDFVGLAENAWDFNDPTAMPGFGPLDYSSEQLAALVDRIVGGAREAAQALSDISVEPKESSQELHQVGRSTVGDAAEQPAVTEPAPIAVQPTQAEDATREIAPAQRRSHGGALPS